MLDVGGTDKSWWFVEWNGKVVRCNLDTNAASQGLRVTADGCHLPFADQSFDVAFSNSVIEHLGSFERQVQFAAEFRRVARRYFVEEARTVGILIPTPPPPKSAAQGSPQS